MDIALVFGILVIVFLGAIVILIGFLWLTYNGLVRGRLRVREAWSGIDVQLKRRSNLVPNLVETVKGYASHEQTVFENVTNARAATVSAGTAAEASGASNMLTGALKTLFAVAEAYPELQASQNFRDLQAELSDIEAKIAYARQFYNANVLGYNTSVNTFPNLLIAARFGFASEEFFEAEGQAREPVAVDFS